MNTGWREYYARYKTYFLNVLGQYKDRGDLRIYVEILLSLATISIFSIFALKPTLVTIAELIKEIDTKKQTLAKLDDKIDKLSKAQIIYDQQRRNISFLDIAIPQRPVPNIFIRQIEGLSSSYQLSIENMSIDSLAVIGAPPDKNKRDSKSIYESASDYSISINLTTNINNFENINKFLMVIEYLKTPVHIDNVTYSLITGGQEEPKIGFTLNGKLLYFPTQSQ